VRRRWCAVLASALVLAACNPKAPAPVENSTSPSPTPSGLSLKITGNSKAEQHVRFVAQGKDNRRDYEMMVRSFESIGAAGSAHLSFQEPHITFFGKDGTTLVADAPHASADQTSNIIMLDGGVRAHSSSGTTLQCDTLTYDRTTQMVHGVGHVIFTNPTGFRGTGNRFDSDVSLTHATMR
jgi:LPS export ABC transporter protein LptC